MGVFVQRAEFIKGCTALAAMPTAEIPEMAVVGRSNVGKSSLINRITGQKKLARTSAVPGKTQECNFYSVSLGKGRNTQRLCLVDLPGYGYAKFSKEKREDLSRLTVEYLQDREQLAIVCLLNDCRRDPGIEELAVRDICWKFERRLLIVLTKMDKLNRKETQERLAALSKSYQLEAADFVQSGEGMPADELWSRVSLLLS